jgi:hypothetical protein
MLCQVMPNENDFYYLKVPARFLYEHLDKFHFVGDKISLYFSTHPKRCLSKKEVAAIWILNSNKGVNFNTLEGRYAKE